MLAFVQSGQQQVISADDKYVRNKDKGNDVKLFDTSNIICVHTCSRSKFSKLQHFTLWLAFTESQKRNVCGKLWWNLFIYIWNEDVIDVLSRKFARSFFFRWKTRLRIKCNKRSKMTKNTHVIITYWSLYTRQSEYSVIISTNLSHFTTEDRNLLHPKQESRRKLLACAFSLAPPFFCI